MKAVFKQTSGNYLEASIETSGTELFVMDEFNGSNLKPNDHIELFIEAGLLNEEESWESIFASNPEKKSELIHLSKGNKYRAPRPEPTL